MNFRFLASISPVILLAILLVSLPPVSFSAGPQAPSRPTSSVEPSPPWSAPLGMTILLMGEDPPARFPANLQWARQLGFDWIQISFPAYQRRFDSTNFPIEDHRSPSLESLSDAIICAKNAGMQVALHPLLLIQDPLDPHWRGQLKPDHRSRWFESYKRWILDLAQLAQQHQVDLFFIGSELSSMQRDTVRWNHIIEQVRLSFSGWISYSANWDDWQQIEFARHLDALGLNGYIPLATDPHDRNEALIARWLPFRSQIHRWTVQSGIPVFFSELGFPAHSLGLKEPWNHTVQLPADPWIQARGYQSFFDTFSADPHLQGVFFYALHMDGGEQDPSYTPAGKPAQHLIRAFLQHGKGKSR
ncbi:MAG: hypothetical protein OSB09_00990 [Planctomycetota bacterium]|nr:hypothetical protein [Planctomycetota bacterium]